jgi:hypothetical protein
MGGVLAEAVETGTSTVAVPARVIIASNLPFNQRIMTSAATVHARAT